MGPMPVCKASFFTTYAGDVPDRGSQCSKNSIKFDACDRNVFSDSYILFILAFGICQARRQVTVIWTFVKSLIAVHVALETLGIMISKVVTVYAGLR